MPRGRKLVEFPGASQPERADISSELKSWIKNAVVPILVREFIAEKHAPISLAPQRVEVLEIQRTVTAAERIAK